MQIHDHFFVVTYPSQEEVTPVTTKNKKYPGYASELHMQCFLPLRHVPLCPRSHLERETSRASREAPSSRGPSQNRPDHGSYHEDHLQ